MQPGPDDPPYTVLSLGMNSDIVSPLLLSRNVQLLYTIDLCDTNFNQGDLLPCGVMKDFSHVQRFIKHILVEGTNIDLICRDCAMAHVSMEYPNVFAALPRKCVILDESLDKKNKRWQLDFEFVGREIRLIFFYGLDYVRDEWPLEIRYVRELHTVGSPYPAHQMGHVLINRMHQRCAPDCVVHTSTLVYEDETEGWFVPKEKLTKVIQNRGYKNVDVRKFKLSDWMKDNQKFKVCCRMSCTKEASKRCGRCHYVSYCSAECQKMDWTITHKFTCHLVQRTIAATKKEEKTK